MDSSVGVPFFAMHTAFGTNRLNNGATP